jgi:Lsr2
MLMAQRIQTLFIDDLDGSPADGTFRFGLDGVEYEIELSKEHGEELYALLEPYIKSARTTAARRPATRSVPHRSTGTTDSVKIREWAREHGVSVKSHGRIPADVVAQYQAAVS